MATKKEKKSPKSVPTSYPSMLATARSFNLSEFAFFGISGTAPLFSLNLEQDAAPVTLRREVFCSNNSAAATPLESRGRPNPQALDFAVLPPGKDTLLIRGTVVATSASQRLHSCNLASFSEKHKSFMDAFVQAKGMAQLAERYLLNMVNGALLFRNRIGSNIRCAVRCDGQVVEVSEADLSKPGALTLAEVTNVTVREQLRAMALVLENALTGKTSSKLFDVRCSVVMGEGQEVYPSQEFLLEVRESKVPGASNRGYKDGRILARALGTDPENPQVAFHARKASNALRTIDTWWPNAYRALPVEPFGIDRSISCAMRSDNAHFYSIVMKLDEMAEELSAGNVSDDALFTAAVFVRGGVFSKSGNESATDESSAAETSAAVEAATE